MDGRVTLGSALLVLLLVMEAVFRNAVGAWKAEEGLLAEGMGRLLRLWPGCCIVVAAGPWPPRSSAKPSMHKKPISVPTSTFKRHTWDQ